MNVFHFPLKKRYLEITAYSFKVGLTLILTYNQICILTEVRDF